MSKISDEPVKVERLTDLCVVSNNVIDFCLPSKIGFSYTDSKIIIQNTKFENCTIKFNYFYRGTYFTHHIPVRPVVIFQKCIFDNCKFEDINLIRLDFISCVLQNIKFDHCIVDVFFIEVTNDTKKPIVNIDLMGMMYNKFIVSYSRLGSSHTLIGSELNNFINEHNIQIASSNRLAEKGIEITGYKIVAIIKRSELEKKDIKDKDLNIIGYGLMTLLIDKDSDRVANIFSSKCRCQRCKIESIHIIYRMFYTGHGIQVNGEQINLYEDNIELDYKTYMAISPMFYNGVYESTPLIYEKGDIIESEFDDDKYKNCAKGIHFFTTKYDALNFAAYNNLFNRDGKLYNI